MNLSPIKFSLAAAAIAVTLPSCLEVSDTVILKKDGSGTIVEEIVLGGQMLDMLEGLSALGGEGGSTPEIFSEKSALDRAKKFGKGVSFTKLEKIESNGAKGARMTFRFDDINTVTLSSSDSFSSIQSMAPQISEQQDPVEKPMTFVYHNGVLTMNNPSASPDQEQQDKAKKAAEEMKEKLGIDAIPQVDPESPEGAQMQGMMMEMFKDMKMSIKLNIEDGISECDATHRDGNTITLADVNFGKLMENEDSLKQMQKLDINDPAAMQQKLASLPGVKVELKKSITIKVK